MENMNFYQIQIGRITRAGNMDALHSFVCRTSNPNRSNVYNHFVTKYSGLNVICDPIKEVITEEIVKEINDYDFGVSEEEKLLRDRIKELESKAQETDRIKDRVHSNKFPDEAKILINEMGKLTKSRINIRKEAELIINNWLRQLYSPFVDYVSFPDNIGDSEEWLKYTVVLKGKLTPNISTLQNK